jgi:hypothetical protein
MSLLHEGPANAQVLDMSKRPENVYAWIPRFKAKRFTCEKNGSTCEQGGFT